MDGRSGDTGCMDTEEPAPRPSGAAGNQAVELCREWMSHLGAVDTVIAVGAAREVCDLYSARYLAWVAKPRINLEVDVVAAAAEVAARDGRKALIFLHGGAYPDAQDLADTLGIGLLRFDAYAGDLDGANAIGRRLRSGGLASA